MTHPLVATLESGGTKMVVALASGPDDVRVRAEIPTTIPAETIPALVAFFEQATSKHGSPDALAIGTFGPADLNPDSPTFGHITKTPKEEWAHTDLLGPLREALNVPAVFETDVNAALIGEATWGAAMGLNHATYFTIGTGIGGGIMVNDTLLHGMGHTEAGHMRVTRHAQDSFAGCCPFHQDCLEGLASGTALQSRWGVSAQELPHDHEAWDLQAYYLAQACMNILTIASPQKIILGGGVMHQEHLFPLIRAHLKDTLNDYLAYPELKGDLQNFIVSPALSDNVGLLGCVALGQRKLGFRVSNS